MVAIASNIPRHIPGPMHPSAVQSQLKEALLAKLGALDPETLDQLQKSFFEAAQGSTKLPSAAAFAMFGAQTPALALLANAKALGDTYYQAPTGDAAKDRGENSNPNSPQNPASPKMANGRPFYGAGAKGPGIFSNPSTEKVAAAIRQQQQQALNFLANQLGQAYGKGDMSEFLGPNICFEDALAEMLFKIADKEQRDLMEQLRQYERGDQGLTGMLAKGAKGLAGTAAGAAGLAVGTYFGGPAAGATAAAVGYDLGQKAVGEVTGHYGESSKQVQFQKIQMSVQNMTQMIQMLSNVLHAFDSANRNTISNMRG